METTGGITAILGSLAKFRIATISFVMSVRPHGTTRLTLDDFLNQISYLSFF